eukprot:Seg540.5 transcript_id=Seg540.5/GoldUCD/mRNA.D3Y31 product="hypothetical protein" protein_id=Seg540.5/GoldUCD/D3Y31
MHNISKETAKDLDLPYRVAVSFGTLRLMSSSYNQFLKLEVSLEAYIEAYRDHDNKEIGEYKIAADDFVFDLLGTIDLLWPLVLLMLRGQLQWCPGWKFTGWLPLVKEQLRKFATDIRKEKPCKNVCPRIFEHGRSISKMRYKRTELVEGWLIVEDAIATNGQNKEDDQSLSESEDESIAAVRGNHQKADQKQPKPVTWLRRELKDCREDLSDLASKMIQEMEKRQKQCLPDLMGMLHKCLDFGNHFDAVVVSKSGKKKLCRRRNTPS